MAAKTDPTKALLLAALDEAFERKSWHGTNLKGSIRGMSATQAAWRPSPARKCIAEIVVHAAYWKYTVRRRILGEPKGSFPLEGSNWFPLESPFDNSAWRRCVQLLVSEHQKLRAAIAELPPAALLRPVPSSELQCAFLIRGVAAHDLYHTGQIQTLKALAREMP